MTRLLHITAIALAVIALAGASRADIIHLRNGNAMEGEIVEETDDTVKVKLPAGSITFKKDDIKRIERKLSPLKQYERALARLEDDDSVGHYFLGVWCQKAGLAKQAEAEFLQTIAINPNHEDARKELGHEMHGGKWLTKDDALRAKGFVKYKGKWLTQDQADKLIAADEQRKWRRTFKQAAGLLCGRKQGEGRAVFEEASVGHAPAVVVPALRSITRHKCALAREEAAKALGRFRTPEAFEALIEAVLNERDNEVLEVIAANLKALNSKRAARHLMRVLRDLRKALTAARNDDKPSIVKAAGRASAAMGMLGEKMVVPELARSLVLTVNYLQLVDSTTTTGGPMTSSLSSLGPITVNDGTVNLEAATTSGVTISTSSKTTKLISTYYNEKASAALRRLTGERFSFDRRKWLEWWATHKPAFPPEEHEFELN
ncbi:MAG: HEAT repeat domain-containing protein [Planctomycetes bacterium]|nr:HEAT repeat domain-containing protein [Planctomycetota bacterium]